MKKTNNKIKTVFGSAALAVALAAGAALFGGASAQAKDFGHHVADEVTKKECGACHTPYPPYMLPARSWKKIMATLSDHFGEDAWLPEETRVHIDDYLTGTAGDSSGVMFAKMYMRSIPEDTTPLRISDTRPFKGEHQGVRSRHPKMWEKAGKTWAACGACHEKATEGYFE